MAVTAAGHPSERPAGSPGGAGADISFTPLYRFIRVLVRLVNRILFRTSVEGAELVPLTGPVIIAPVHRSFIDFLVASEVTRRKLHYMAKDSLWDNRPLARILPTLGAFPVRREAADREVDAPGPAGARGR